MLFHPEDYPFQHVALKYALQYINADHELLPGTNLSMLELNLSQPDSFSTGKRGNTALKSCTSHVSCSAHYSCPEHFSCATVCGAVSEGVAAVIGPRAPATTGIVHSVCETLEVPNLQIYPEVPQYPGCCLINLYPAQESVAQVRDTQSHNHKHAE